MTTNSTSAARCGRKEPTSLAGNAACWQNKNDMKITRDPADTAFSIWIRLRDRKCLRCLSAVRLNADGKPVSHQASHFYSRGAESTRFDEDNVCTLCTGCHTRFTAFPAEHVEWQKERLGERRYQALELRYRLKVKKDRKLALIYWKKRLAEDFGLKI